MNSLVTKWPITSLISGALLLGMQPLLAACDSQLPLPEINPDIRYIDNGDDTITDKQTGLMWKQCSEGLMTTTTACNAPDTQPQPNSTENKFSWSSAMKQAKDVNALNNGSGFAGHTDWRLPNRNELASLIAHRCANPSIRDNLFPNTYQAGYWSSSPYSNHSEKAWVINFSIGTLQTAKKMFLSNYVRLVRGGYKTPKITTNN